MIMAGVAPSDVAELGELGPRELAPELTAWLSRVLPVPEVFNDYYPTAVAARMAMKRFLIASHADSVPKLLETI